MKKVLLFFILCLLSMNDAFSQQYGWVDISGNLPDFPGDTLIINNPPDTVVAGIHSLYFINDSVGWISTFTIPDDSCMILHTTDGGNTWEVQPIRDYIVSIEMFNESEGYAAAREGCIYHTIDGGGTWEFHATTFAWLNDMDFPEGSDTGYACGDNSAMVRITPEGTGSWTTGTVSNLYGVSFPETDNKGWAAGQAIIVMYENGNWTSLPSLPAGTYTDIFFINDQTGWVCGSVLGKTLNGTNWQTCPNYPALQGDLIKLFFLDASNGWGVGTSGQILQTSDGGDNWFSTSVGMGSECLINVQFTSLTNGYICGNDKVLLKYTQISSVDDVLTQNELLLFPNPTTGKFRINITNTDQNCECVIYDIFGMKVCENVKLNHDEIDISDLAPAVYFIHVKTGQKVYVQKIIKQ